MIPHSAVFLMPLLSAHPYFVSFLVAMFSEEVLFFLAILSGSGLFPFFKLFIAGFFGIVLADCVCFFLGKTRFLQYIRENHFTHKRYRSLRTTLSKFSDNRFVFLLTSKFVYGTRAAAAVVNGLKGVKFWEFLVLDIIAVLIWQSVMLPLAWLSGRGIYAFFRVTKGFEKFLLIALLLLIVYHLILKNIANKFRGK